MSHARSLDLSWTLIRFPDVKPLGLDQTKGRCLTPL
jgi:hypothetical protein